MVNDDPEVARWECAMVEHGLRDIVTDYLALKSEMLTVIELASDAAT